MDSFLFALNAVLPIILTVAVGYLLKRIGLIGSDLAKGGNKLVFKVFLPCLLFLNVYKIDNLSAVGYGFIIYAVVAVLLVFAVALPLVILLTKNNPRRGALLQGTFRSNYALIGIPLAISIYGDMGGAVASLLSAVSIPLYNVLAVISLSIFTGGGKPNFKKIGLGILKNPLIIGVALGCFSLLIRHLFVGWGIEWRLSDVEGVYKALTYLANAATPVALVMLGAQFEFSAIPGMKKELIFGVMARIIVVPLITISIACLIPSFNGSHIAALFALFATPVAVSSVPMAQETGNDASLAGQLVVWTTFLSAFTLFGFIFVLRLIGVLV